MFRFGIELINPRLILARNRYANTIYGHSPTEHHPLETCAEECIRNHRPMSLHIFNYNQAVLKTPRSFTVESKRAWICLGAPNRLQKENKVSLMTVSIPGYSREENNEKDINSLLVGPETISKLSKSEIRILTGINQDAANLGIISKSCVT